VTPIDRSPRALVSLRASAKIIAYRARSPGKALRATSPQPMINNRSIKAV
jgi:hypothetical protein